MGKLLEEDEETWGEMKTNLPVKNRPAYIIFKVESPSANAINNHPMRQGMFSVNNVAFLPKRSSMDPVIRHPIGVDIEARLAVKNNSR